MYEYIGIYYFSVISLSHKLNFYLILKEYEPYQFPPAYVTCFALASEVTEQEILRTCRTAFSEESAVVNPLTPELNPSAQRCLTRFFTGEFVS
jgi:hypothetical protein